MTHDPVSDYCSRPESCHSFVSRVLSLQGVYLFFHFLVLDVLIFIQQPTSKNKNEELNPPT